MSVTAITTARLWKLWAASWVLAALCGPVVGTGGAALALRYASGPQALPFFLLGSLAPAFIAGTLIGKRVAGWVPPEVGRAQRAAVVVGFAMISVSLSLASGVHLIALALRVQGVGIAVASWPVGLLGCAAGIVATLAPLISMAGHRSRAHESEWTEPADEDHRSEPFPGEGIVAEHEGDAVVAEDFEREPEPVGAMAHGEPAAMEPAAFDAACDLSSRPDPSTSETPAATGERRTAHTFGDPPFAMYSDHGPTYPTYWDFELSRARPGIEVFEAESGVAEIELGTPAGQGEAPVAEATPREEAERVPASPDASSITDEELAALEPLFVGPPPAHAPAGWSFGGTRAPALPRPAEDAIEAATTTEPAEALDVAHDSQPAAASGPSGPSLPGGALDLSDKGTIEFPGRAPSPVGEETLVIENPSAVFEQVPLEQPARWPEDPGIQRGHSQFYAPSVTGEAASHGSLGPDWQLAQSCVMDERWDPMHPPVPVSPVDASLPASARPVEEYAPVFIPSAPAAAVASVGRPILAGSPFASPLEDAEPVRPALRGSPMDQSSLDDAGSHETSSGVAPEGSEERTSVLDATPALVTAFPESRSARKRKRQRQAIEAVQSGRGRGDTKPRVRRAS